MSTPAKAPPMQGSTFGTLDERELSAAVLSGPLTKLILPPRQTFDLPSLSKRSSDEPFPGWTVTTHVIPAAFPRSARGSTTTPRGLDHRVPEEESLTSKLNVSEVYNQLMDRQIRALETQVDAADAKAVGDQLPLFASVNRYTRRGARPDEGLSLVFAHANGFHKEIYEPTMADLVASLDGATEGPKVSEMWSLDSIHQGDSGVLNEKTLGPTFNWADNGRDILAFLVNHIHSVPTESTSEPLAPRPPNEDLLELDHSPVLPGHSPPESRSFGSRRIVGIGHSLGGGGMTFAASTLPALFSSLILIDPVLSPAAKTVRALTTGALVRRDKWASREEAKEAMLKKPFFAAWDSRVLDAYVQFGLKETNEGVTLKARAKDEALVFCDPGTVASRRANARLSTLPATLPVHFILADIGRSVLPEENLKKVVAKVRHATQTRVEGAGHLVAQERPKETAAVIVECLKRWYPVSEREAYPPTRKSKL